MPSWQPTPAPSRHGPSVRAPHDHQNAEPGPEQDDSPCLIISDPQPSRDLRHAALVLTTDHTGPVSVQWSATATNVSGRVEGNIDLALEDEAEDLTTALQHRVGDDLIVFRGGEMLRGDEL